MIAATVLRMWKNEEEYDPGRAGLPTSKNLGRKRKYALRSNPLEGKLNGLFNTPDK
jgi:hypothetical protein